MRELHHVQPARDERAGPGCDDGPGHGGRLKLIEEGAGSADPDGRGAVFERDGTFDFADVGPIGEVGSEQSENVYGAAAVGGEEDFWAFER